MDREKGPTRAQAERLVAQTEDAAALLALATHKNKHVRAKATYKLKLLDSRSAAQEATAEAARAAVSSDRIEAEAQP